MSVIWVKVEDEELHPRSQSFCIHSSSVQLTVGIAASFCTPPSRVWTSGGLMAISLNFGLAEIKLARRTKAEKSVGVHRNPLESLGVFPANFCH